MGVKELREAFNAVGGPLCTKAFLTMTRVPVKDRGTVEMTVLSFSCIGPDGIAFDVSSILYQPARM